MSDTIAVEKTSNFIMKPILRVKRYPLDLSSDPKVRQPCNQKDVGVVMWDYWDEKNFMILNVIAQSLLNIHYNNDVPKSHFHDRVLHWVKCRRGSLDQYRSPVKSDLLQMLDGTDQGSLGSKQARIDEYEKSVFYKRRYDIELSEEYLYLKFPFLQKYSSKKLCDLITQTSSVHFFPLKFDVKILKQKAEYKRGTTSVVKWHYSYEFYPFRPQSDCTDICNCFNFFDVEVKPVKLSKHNPPRILERSYEIKFDGLMAKFFANNVMFLNTVYMPIKVFELSPNAQMIYRRFILPVIGSCFRVRFKDIYKYVGPRNSDKARVKMRVNAALEELKDAKLIGDFKIESVKKHRIDWTMYRIMKHKDR